MDAHRSPQSSTDLFGSDEASIDAVADDAAGIIAMAGQPFR
jgi:hypothetical protein